MRVLLLLTGTSTINDPIDGSWTWFILFCTKRMYVRNIIRGVVATPVATSTNFYNTPAPGATPAMNKLLTKTRELLKTNVGSTVHRGFSSSSQTELVGEDRAPIKSYKSIPRAGLPGIGNLPDILRHGFGAMHLNQIKMCRKYGMLFRVQVGPSETLQISDPDLVKEMMRQEDWNPVRVDIAPWKAYRDLRGVDYGLVTLDHEPWQKARSILSKPLLRPKEIVQYMDKLNETGDELIQRLVRVMKDTGEGNTVPDLDNELYKWALEAVAIVLFDVRLGCMKDSIPAEAQEFIDAINKMFSTLAPLMLIPMRVHTSLNTKVWRKHVEAWDTIWNTAMKYINQKCKSISESNKHHQEDQVVDLLTYLLAKEKLSMSEICGNVAELLLGGVDTTSHTLLWAMYRLSRAPDCQERLHSELVSVLNGAPLNEDNINQLPYLRSVIRETLRLHPVVVGNSRIPKKDITLQGFNVPKGTLVMMANYAMSRGEGNFADANEFKPERWLRGNDESKMNKFASLPFGYGTRMCVGKRLAEMEIKISLSKICLKFFLEPTNDEELVGKLRGILIPEKNIPVKFVHRNVMEE
ncbi:cytochrome P450 27C1-like [Anneissia japonica]|uniref:cytochrome P450 27C1-like n=1 Tax=Anneissia japonica TaxID=1529436 RepID=UPI001425AFE5|nr:cytochrome P450 27C1-like [Anneissia japonica]